MHYRTVLALLPLLAGCGIETKNPADVDNKVIIEADESGQVSFDLPIAEGKLMLPSSMIGKGDVDIDGVKMMPGSSVTGFSVMAGNEGANVVIAFNSPASPDEVRSYYAERLRGTGADAQLSGDSVTGTLKDGNPFRIEVNSAPGGSSGRITMRNKV